MADEATVRLECTAQFVRDLSFESPGVPGTLLHPGPVGPGVEIHVEVRNVPTGEDSYAVDLLLHGKATAGDRVMFAFELSYSGAFRIHEAAPAALPYALAVECPKMLFPFARQVLAQATRDGGFPPLYVDTPDFAGMLANAMRDADVPAVPDRPAALH